MSSWAENATVLGTFIGAAIWMMRSAMNLQRNMAERFIRHLETSLDRQGDEHRVTRHAIRALTSAVRRNSRLIISVQEASIGSIGDQSDGKKQMPDKRN